MRRKIFIRKNKPRDLDKLSYYVDEVNVIVEWSRLGFYKSGFRMIQRQLRKKSYIVAMVEKLNAIH